MITAAWRHPDVVEYLRLVTGLQKRQIQNVLRIHEDCVLEILRVGGAYRFLKLGTVRGKPGGRVAERDRLRMKAKCKNAKRTPVMTFSINVKRLLAEEGAEIE